MVCLLFIIIQFCTCSIGHSRHMAQHKQKTHSCCAALAFICQVGASKELNSMWALRLLMLFALWRCEQSLTGLPGMINHGVASADSAGSSSCLSHLEHDCLVAEGGSMMYCQYMACSITQTLQACRIVVALQGCRA